MIPLKCESVDQRYPPATISLIIVCVLLYFVRDSAGPYANGFVPLDFMHSLFHPGRVTLNNIFSCFMALFMHANLFHLLSNMWYLWIFGGSVECRSGFGRFMILFIVCGFFSMMAQAGFSPLSKIPIIGSSGAIAGVMGMHLIMIPFSRVLMWIPPIFFIHIPAFIFLLLWFYIQYINAGANSNSYVAWWAHIGGFIAGVIFGLGIRYGVFGKMVVTKTRRKN